jgi:vitamin B12/bleomycin/antimicrobial peptide transport system ATP-binding/permease protein
MVKTMSQEFAPSGGHASTPGPSDLPSNGFRRHYLLRQFRQTASGFWLDNARPEAWLLSAALLLVIILLLGAAYAMNAWHRAMFDGLQHRDAAAVGRLSLLYFAILAVSVLLSISQVYVRMTLQRKWRAWVSNTSWTAGSLKAGTISSI